MIRTSFAALAICLFGCFAHGYTLEFQPTLEIWKCPPGASYVILQCQAIASKALPKVKLQLTTVDTQDPAYTADWAQSVTAPGEPISYFYLNVLRYHDAKGKPLVSLSASAGWNTDANRNSSVFFEADNSGLPTTFMVTGDRLTEGDHEIETDLEIVDLKFR